jgi:hypothetical protein
VRRVSYRVVPNFSLVLRQAPVPRLELTLTLLTFRFIANWSAWALPAADVDRDA